MGYSMPRTYPISSGGTADSLRATACIFFLNNASKYFYLSLLRRFIEIVEKIRKTFPQFQQLLLPQIHVQGFLLIGIILRLRSPLVLGASDLTEIVFSHPKKWKPTQVYCFCGGRSSRRAATRFAAP